MFAKERYTIIHQLTNVALGCDSESGNSDGGTPPKPEPPNLREEVNEGAEERNKDGSYKQNTFEMFSILKGISKEAHDPVQDEFTRTEEFGFIVMEQGKSKMERC